MAWSRTGSVDPVARRVLPTWLAPVPDAIERLRVDDVTRFAPPDSRSEPAAGAPVRLSAVLILLSDDRDVLLIERAASIRSHPGQPAFPGGGIEPSDADATAGALREAHEETGLDPDGVVPFGSLPDLWVPVSNHVVTPVVAWWRTPTPVFVNDVHEVAAVHRVPLADLIDPANRCLVRHPSGYAGPGFLVAGMLVWGFTGGLLDRLLDAVGWALPWDPTRVVPIDPGPVPGE